MNAQIDLMKINDKIRSMKKEAEELIRIGKDFPAIEKNTARILASIKMLELTITDALDL
jgi:hypothetical protein